MGLSLILFGGEGTPFGFWRNSSFAFVSCLLGWFLLENQENNHHTHMQDKSRRSEVGLWEVAMAKRSTRPGAFVALALEESMSFVKNAYPVTWHPTGCFFQEANLPGTEGWRLCRFSTRTRLLSKHDFVVFRNPVPTSVIFGKGIQGSMRIGFWTCKDAWRFP